MTLYAFISSILSAVYIHDLSPFAIRFTETMGIRWYGLSYLAGFLSAYFIILNLSKKGQISLKPQLVSDFIFYAAVGAILGGRLGYCIFYDSSLFTKMSETFPFWGVLEVHKGGMASHGGILGVMLACLLFAKKELIPKIELLDLVALTACLGIMFGRMANFVNGELVGRPASESYAFAVKFPQDLLSWHYTNPEQLGKLSKLANAVGYSEAEVNQAILSKSSYFFDLVATKAIEQIQLKNSVVKEEAAQILIARHPSQLYEALLEGLLLFLLILFARSRFRQVGVASSVFVVTYPLLRIVAEQFRLPDAQIGFQMLGLTRGQWISIFMFIAGVIYSIVVLSAKAAKQKELA